MYDPARALPKDTDAYDEEYVMPCAEALMAGTLALMTGYACCVCAQHRDMMAKKAVSNLHALSQHPQLSMGLRAVATRLQGQWAELIQKAHGDQITTSPAQLSRAEQSRALWHTTPEAVQ